jgi:hypothetical protein
MSSNCPALFTGRGEAKEKQSIEVHRSLSKSIEVVEVEIRKEAQRPKQLSPKKKSP